jgi:RNA polymerase sigma-70 factor (ECF subfamily)
VLNATDWLPPTRRETVLPVDSEGFSYAEAASALGIPVGTVMSRVGAARSTLAKLKEHFTFYDR